MMNALEQVRLAKTDVTVTRLGLGTAPLGGWPTALAEEQAVATIRRAWELGLRYFDTAPLYGHGLSERYLKTVLTDKRRDQFALSTKVGRLLRPGQPKESMFVGAAPLTPIFDFSYEGTLRSLRESRERLGIEQIDLALIHDPDDHHEEALEGAYRALADLRAKGTLGAIGVGMNRSEPLARFAVEAEFDCFLLAGRYTLLEQESLNDLLPIATERGVSIIAAGVYNSGLLANPGPGTTYNYAPAEPALIARARRLEAICGEFGISLRAAAIQFPLAHPAVACVVVGARSPQEVDDNVALLGVEIPTELWDTLKDRGLLRRDAPSQGSLP